MITEDYVSFETAKLLKEKGFYGECLSMYLTPKPHCGIGNPNEPKIAPHGRDSHYYEGYLYQCEAPTLQMAMKWLRETYDIDFDINTTGSRHVRRYHLAIWENKDEEMVTINPIGYFNKWEQACEAAIKYCLENLITPS